jgi:hypothetical protein
MGIGEDAGNFHHYLMCPVTPVTRFSLLPAGVRARALEKHMDSSTPAEREISVFKLQFEDLKRKEDGCHCVPFKW